MSSEITNPTTLATNADSNEVPFPRSRQPEEFVQYLCRTHVAGIEVDFRRADGKLWAMALDGLMNNSRIEEARALAPRMAVAFPGTSYFRTMATLFDRLPEPCEDPSFAAFRDDKTKEVQIIPRAGANCVLIAFCGRAPRIGMPIDLIHRWFGQLGVHVIYLRDYEGHNYDQGIRSLSAIWPAHCWLCERQSPAFELIGLCVTGIHWAVMVRCDTHLNWRQKRHSLSPHRLIFFPTSVILSINKTPSPASTFALSIKTAITRLGCILFMASIILLIVRKLSISEVFPPLHSRWLLVGNHHDVFLHAIFVGRYEPLLRWLVDPTRTAGRP